MAMQVRPARPEDRAAMLDLWERSVRATHDFLGEGDIVALRPLVAQGLASDAVGWWVLAPDAGAVAGFLGYTPGTIEALFIDPDRFGQGGGRRPLPLGRGVHARRRGRERQLGARGRRRRSRM